MKMEMEIEMEIEMEMEMEKITCLCEISLTEPRVGQGRENKSTFAESSQRKSRSYHNLETFSGL